MSPFNSGFSGRRRADHPNLPPGQYLTESFPVLSAGPTPRVDRETFEFAIENESGYVKRWSWADLMALPIDEVTTDIHCVTSWSKFSTSWRGVSLDTLLADVETSAQYATAHSYGGYTTNLPLDDLLHGKAWVAFEFDGVDLEPEHGGPARLLVPHLYFWKSAKWIKGLRLTDDDAPGFWEQNGYHMYGDPWLEQRYS